MKHLNTKKTISLLISICLSIYMFGQTVTTYQAEDATLTGDMEITTKHSGYNGTGYVGFPSSGGSVEFQNIDGGIGGNFILKVRWALGKDIIRTGNLIVNGVNQSLSMESTVEWSNWATKPIIVSLNSGTNNSIELITTGDDFGNVDEITISEVTPMWQPILFDDFEDGLGNYTSGGANCRLYTGTTYAESGSSAANIEAGNGEISSFTSTNSMDLSDVSSLRVDFWYYPVSMDNSTEDFWLQLFNGWNGYFTYKTFTQGVDFENDQMYHAVIDIPWEDDDGQNLHDNSKIRFMCDASGGGDDIYIDDIKLSIKRWLQVQVGSGSGDGAALEGSIVNISADAPQPGFVFDKWTGDVSAVSNIYAENTTVILTQDLNVTATYIEEQSTEPVWTEILSENFEGGYGIFNDGGSDCKLYTGGTYAHEGTNTLNIEDNTSSSVSELNNSIDLSSSSELKINFWYYAVSMESNEDFWVQYNDGSGWQTIASYARGVEFENNQYYNPEITITSVNYNFSANANIRFVCDASGGGDDIYIDEVVISTLSGSGSGSGSNPNFFAAKINFQPTGFSTPSGYIADEGAVYADRSNGYNYGWITGDNSGNARDRSNPADDRYATMNHMKTSRTWEIEVPNGTYDVFLVCGDGSYTDHINNMDIEGTVVNDPDGEDNFDEFSLTGIEVIDGILTIKPASGADNAKICFIEITGVGELKSESVVTEIFTQVIEKQTLELSSYPNPIVNNATVKFSLNQSSDVNITLYNLMGEQVELITNQYYNSGTHELSFTKGNLSSGVYLLQLMVGNNREINKIIIK